MSQRVSDEQLENWHARWPSVLPTSVPHELVCLLIEDVRDARAEIARLHEALTKAEPWSHVVACPPSMGTMKEPFGSGLASMSPGIAESPSPVAHWRECPGCAARAALQPGGGPND